MKKPVLTLLTVLSCAGALLAQPTIPGSKFFIPGYTLNYLDGTTGGVTPGNAGANQTWDFSAVTSGGSGYVNAYATASSTPYASNFPGSNIAMYDPTSATPAYSYLTTSASSAVLNGLYADINGTPVAYVYSNPMQAFSFPLTMGTTVNDTYSGTLTMSQQGVTLTNYRDGSLNAIVDGYGTVITPTGTYTNCLRVKLRDVVRDSLVYVGLPVPPSVSETRSTSYIYFDGNGALAVDRFRMEYDTTTDANGTTYDFQVFYLSSVTTGISDVKEASALSLYPNPAVSEVNFTPGTDLNGNAEIRITDLSGRILSTETMYLRSGSPVAIPVQNLNGGVYLMQVTVDAGTWTGRFVRQ